MVDLKLNFAIGTLADLHRRYDDEMAARQFPAGIAASPAQPLTACLR
jgi:hypothetical protein